MRDRFPCASTLLLAIIVAVLLFFALGGTSNGAQSEVDAIGAAFKPYFDEFSAVPPGSKVFPSSAETETALIGLWHEAISESACEEYAGAALSFAASLGDFAETGEPAYLDGAILLYPQMEAIEYACLIEA